MTTIFPETAAPKVPISGSDLSFPVRRIYCVGRNYAAHAKEMGHDERDTPFFFSKPSDSIVINPKAIPYPPMTNELHHEVELVVALSEELFECDIEAASEAIYGYALGIDFTKRDLQSQAKSKGRPWDLAKGFDQSAPLTDIQPLDSISELAQGAIKLSVNGKSRQDGNLNEMIWSAAEVVVELSKHITLKPGDLIFTGTPSGVGEVVEGDRIHASLKDLQLDFTVE